MISLLHGHNRPSRSRTFIASGVVIRTTFSTIPDHPACCKRGWVAVVWRTNVSPQVRDSMTNLLLYAEARQTIAQMNSAAEAGHDNLRTGNYPYAYPDEVFEELAREHRWKEVAV